MNETNSTLQSFNLHSVLATDAYISVNKQLIKKVGLIAASMLGELISKEKFYYQTGQLTDDGMFYFKMSDFEDLFNVKRKPIESGRKALEEANFIKVERRGIPAKLYYSINHIEIANALGFNSVPKKDNQESDIKTPDNQNDNKPEEKKSETPDNQQSAQKGHTGVSKKDILECPKRTIINKNRDIRIDDNNSLLTRIENFKNEAEQIYQNNKESFPKLDLKAYLNYWTEYSPGEMMFKAEKTGSFNHFNRFTSWNDKESKFTQKTGKKSKSERITDGQELRNHFLQQAKDLENNL